MKLKNFLIESAYFPSMLIATWFMVSSCAVHAQIRPRTPDNAKQRLVYMRGDTVFQRNSNGVEEPLLPPSVYQYHIDSLEAELYLYKPKPGVIIIELDTTSNRMVYRKKIGYVKITNLYDDSLWVTDSIFVTAHRLNDGRVSQTIKADSTFGALNSENILRDSSHATETIKVWDAAKWENVIVTPPPIRGDSLFIDGSTFVLLQRLNKSKFGWVTDSIKWVVMDTTFKGNLKCEHEWVYSEPKMQGNRFGAYVFDKHTINVVCARGAHYANGKWDESPFHSLDEHCQYEEREREKICRKCLRSEIEREQWYQRFIEPPKSEFELLKEKQNARHR